MLSTKCYVLEVVGGCSISTHTAKFDPDGAGQRKLARKLAKQNGRAAVLSGEVQYFWADVVGGELEVGHFDEELCPEED